MYGTVACMTVHNAEHQEQMGALLLQELKKALAREPSDVQGFFNTDNWLRALRQSRDLDQDPPFPPPTGVPHTPSLVSVLPIRHCLSCYNESRPEIWERPIGLLMQRAYHYHTSHILRRCRCRYDLQCLPC